MKLHEELNLDLCNNVKRNQGNSYVIKHVTW